MSSRPAADTRQSNERLSRLSRTKAGSASDDAGWRMPSGLGLAEFALRGGFVAPGLMKRTAPHAGDRP